MTISPPLDAQAGADAAAEDAADTLVGAVGFETAVGHHLREATNARGMQIVVAQELLDRAALVGVPVAERGRDALLMLEQELVLVAAGDEMQRVAHLPQEVLRAEHEIQLALRHHPLLHDLAQ